MKGWSWTVGGIAILAVVLFPIYWMVNVSLQPSSGAVETPWVPLDLDLSGYTAALRDQGGHLLTSLIVSILGILAALGLGWFVSRAGITQPIANIERQMRSLADGECAPFTTWCPAGTTIETLVAVEGQRWAIEDAFETAKNELGLDHNETRSWHGWHRHVSLVMLAFAMLATIQHKANAPPPKTLIRLTRTRRTSSAGRSRRSAASQSASRSGASSPPTSSPGHSGAARTKPPHNAHI